MMNHSRIETALEIAISAHAGQMRKESSRPYIVHPVSVALILARYQFSDTVVAAALVHDVLEDTVVTETTLRQLLGDTVVTLVLAVTHDADLPWEEKKKAYIEMVRRASDDVKALSVADKIANARSLIAAHDVQGSAVWAHFNAGREKKLWFEEAMLTMLRETWQHPLVEEYAALVAQMRSLA